MPTKLSTTCCSNCCFSVDSEPVAVEDEILLRWLEETRRMPTTDSLSRLIDDTWRLLHYKHPDLIEAPTNH